MAIRATRDGTLVADTLPPADAVHRGRIVNGRPDDGSEDVIAVCVRTDDGSCVWRELQGGGLPSGGAAGQVLRVRSGDTAPSWQADATVNVMDYGAIGDGSSHLLSERFATLAAAQAVYPHATALTNEIDWCAITLAMSVAKGSGDREDVGTVVLPIGGFLLHTTLTVPNWVRVVGQGVRGTLLRASLAFPAATRLVVLGDDPIGYTFGSRLEHLSVWCNNVAGSIGVYSNNLQEFGGLIDVTVERHMARGIVFETSGAGVNSTNYILRDVTVGSGVGAMDTIGFDLNGGSWKTTVENIGIGAIRPAPEELPAKQLAAIRLTNGRLNIRGLHMEYFVDGVRLDGTDTNVTVDNVTALDVDYPIHAAAGNLGRWSVQGLRASGHTYSIWNENLGHQIPSSYVPLYIQDGGATSYAITSADVAGVPSRFRELQIGSGAVLKRHVTVRPSLTWGSIPAGGTETKTITVTGAGGGDVVLSGPPATLQSTLVVASARVTAADTVSLTIYNPTAGAITPVAGAWRISVMGY